MTGKSIALALLVLAVAAVAACEPTGSAETGAVAPELAALDLDDAAVRLDALRGKVVLVNFWLADCGPCLIEMPQFETVYRQYQPDGFEIIAVNMGQDSETVRNTWRRLNVTYPLVTDPLRITTARYAVEAAPTSFLIDRQGIVRERIDAPMTRADLARRVAEIL